jgi:hypothetical protein
MSWENLVAAIDANVIKDAGEEMSGDTLRKLRGPGVYLISLGNELLYVGSAHSLLSRVGQRRHGCDRAMEECDKLLMMPCKSLAAARELEELMIAWLRPRYNKSGKTSALAELLDVNPAQARWYLNTPHPTKPPIEDPPAES